MFRPDAAECHLLVAAGPTELSGAMVVLVLVVVLVVYGLKCVL
jgi:hypothetical protein